MAVKVVKITPLKKYGVFKLKLGPNEGKGGHAEDMGNLTDLIRGFKFVMNLMEELLLEVVLGQSFRN